MTERETKAGQGLNGENQPVVAPKPDLKHKAVKKLKKVASAQDDYSPSFVKEPSEEGDGEYHPYRPSRSFDPSGPKIDMWDIDEEGYWDDDGIYEPG